ncbi:MAG TPA: sigma-54 dependent transcriptional regulator [Alphaproteobacteria bacterium]|nr:sigma-54-dependent Fis family transcriptional regulator [Rhodospirillaceae bacterium]HRJ11655.1 sigma-54 dependent transcriptional regulator [Alphaproteobacteria bacterium]
MRLMIVGQLEGHVVAAGKIATSRGAKVTHADSAERALNALRSGKGADLLMVEIKQDIAGLIKSLQDERIVVPVVACGIGTEKELAVAAIKAGAKEYVPLPPDADLIAAVLQAVAEEQTDFIAEDPAMLKVLQMADQVAGTDATVLITGESGTGKEVMAQYIHRKSRRATGSFIATNCAAIPETLLESELFGHEKGAFTGAVARRLGKFEEADNGTLFLDEVTEMPMPPQAKLLRAIQEKEITRLGSNSPVKVNIRLIATSNRDLQQAVKDKVFREDLYFRLNVINISLPPLRDRTKDIPALANFFVKKYADANYMAPKSISDAAMQKLMMHSWPGNVRELENTMHRALLLSGDDGIDVDAIMLSGQPQAGGDDGDIDDETFKVGMVGKKLEDVERQLIIDTLTHTLGNRTHAANILGISIRTLRNKLRQYNAEGHAVPPPPVGEAAAEAASA